MNATAKTFLVIAAFLALSSIILGTIAAHAPSEQLIAAKQWFDTAMQYHQFHSLALLAVGLLAAHWPSRWFAAAGVLMIVATVLFSGTLYLRSMAGLHAVHWLTPYGGWCYLAAWIALIGGVLTASRRA
ncbi:MAG: DUF423 domain-containing protein [Pseudomonadota bacterium]